MQHLFHRAHRLGPPHKLAIHCGHSSLRRQMSWDIFQPSSCLLAFMDDSIVGLGLVLSGWDMTTPYWHKDGILALSFFAILCNSRLALCGRWPLTFSSTSERDVSHWHAWKCIDTIEHCLLGRRTSSLVAGMRQYLSLALVVLEAGCKMNLPRIVDSPFNYRQAFLLGSA